MAQRVIGTNAGAESSLRPLHPSPFDNLLSTVGRSYLESTLPPLKAMSLSSRHSDQFEIRHSTLSNHGVAMIGPINRPGNTLQIPGPAVRPDGYRLGGHEAYHSFRENSSTSGHLQPAPTSATVPIPADLIIVQEEGKAPKKASHALFAQSESRSAKTSRQRKRKLPDDMCDTGIEKKIRCDTGSCDGSM